MHVKAIDHIHIYSHTPSASIEFWQQHFGAKMVFETKNNHDQPVYILQVGNCNLAFSEFPPGMKPAAAAIADDAARQGMAERGVMHLGINVDDVRAAAAELGGRGVTILTEPAEAHGVTFCYVRAPDDVIIELTQY